MSEETSNAGRRLEVARDSTFARAAADRLIMIDLGRDVDVICLQVGPILTAILDQEASDELELSSHFTEVVRLRLSWSTIVDFTMQVLSQGFSSDRIKRDVFKEAIDKMLIEPSDVKGNEDE